MLKCGYKYLCFKTKQKGDFMKKTFRKKINSIKKSIFRSLEISIVIGMFVLLIGYIYFAILIELTGILYYDIPMKILVGIMLVMMVKMAVEEYWKKGD